jgi:dolichyl-phosphate-mannose-protein mannosyltransferase
MAPYDNSLWFIETNEHPILEGLKKAPKMVNYLRPSFWSRFLELNRVMWETNAGLTDRHAYDSRPQTWPVLRRGINFWTKDHRQVYLIGNPFIWWGSLCAIMVYAGARGLLMLRAKRGCKDFQDSAIVFYDQTCGFLILGWAMHFLPFFAMHRQLFLHHYLPALYFSILLLAVLFDVVTSGLRPKYRLIAALAMISIAFASYTTYAPITYATPWTRQSCERARLLKTWDLNCKDFPESVHQYSGFGPGVYFKGDKHSSKHIPAGEGAVTSGVIDQEAVAQAGNYPFQQPPPKVYPSAEIEVGDSQAQGEGVNLGADKVQPDVPAPAPAAPVAAGSAQAGSDKDQKQQQPLAAPPPAQQDTNADLKGLDLEGLEGIVLGGTGTAKDKARAQASAATSPSQMARAVDDKTAVNN